jgi:tetratricopeptide (TPR) repeat protein
MRIITALLIAAAMTGCATSSKATIQPKATNNHQFESPEAAMAEGLRLWEDRLNEESLRKAAEVLETVYAMDPKHPLVLEHLTVAYYQLGYAYSPTDKEKIENHERGRQFALKRLEEHPGYAKIINEGGSMDDAVAAITEPEFVHALQFAAANWAWWAEKTGISKVAFDISKVKALFNRALDLDATYLCSAPRVMAAGFYAKAGAFGGDMDKARGYYEEAIKEEGCYDNKMFFAEFYAIPMDDRELFHRLATEVLEAPEDTSSQMRLENRIAKEKAKALLAKEDEFFF